MRSTFVIAGLLGILASGRAEEAAQNGWTKTVIVPSNVPWTNTGIKVTREQRIRFETFGVIRLSFDGNDVAMAAGARSGRMSAKAPMPSAFVGALIGRVNSSKPFSIGNTAQALQMPADGRLFLGVNDDLVADNSGNYVVRVWEPAPQEALTLRSPYRTVQFQSQWPTGKTH